MINPVISWDYNVDNKKCCPVILCGTFCRSVKDSSATISCSYQAVMWKPSGAQTKNCLSARFLIYCAAYGTERLCGLVFLLIWTSNFTHLSMFWFQNDLNTSNDMYASWNSSCRKDFNIMQQWKNVTCRKNPVQGHVVEFSFSNKI